MSATQSKVLRYIKDFIQTNGYPPTRVEIATEIGVVVNAISGCLKNLEGAGKIRVVPKTARGIVVL